MKPVDTEAINVQAYWMEPAPPPSAEPGMHRVALNVAQHGFGFGRGAPPVPPVDACHPAGEKPPTPETPTPGASRGPLSLEPGNYIVKLTVDGQTLTQPVTILPDPRMLPKGADPSPEEDDDE